MVWTTVLVAAKRKPSILLRVRFTTANAPVTVYNAAVIQIKDTRSKFTKNDHAIYRDIKKAFHNRSTPNHETHKCTHTVTYLHLPPCHVKVDNLSLSLMDTILIHVHEVM
jgi:hypothetical protein